MGVITHVQLTVLDPWFRDRLSGHVDYDSRLSGRLYRFDKLKLGTSKPEIRLIARFTCRGIGARRPQQSLIERPRSDLVKVIKLRCIASNKTNHNNSNIGVLGGLNSLREARLVIRPELSTLSKVDFS